MGKQVHFGGPYLTAAHKQLAVSPDQGFVRVLAAYDPCKKVPAFFLINALPFGATSSSCSSSGLPVGATGTY